MENIFGECSGQVLNYDGSSGIGRVKATTVFWCYDDLVGKPTIPDISNLATKDNPGRERLRIYQ